MHRLPKACTTRGWALHSFPPTSSTREGHRADSPGREREVLNSANSNRQLTGPVLHLLTQFVRGLLLHETEVSTVLHLLNWQLDNKKKKKSHQTPTTSEPPFFSTRHCRPLRSPGNSTIFPSNTLHNSHLLTPIQSLMQRLADLVTNKKYFKSSVFSSLCTSVYTGSKCKTYCIKIQKEVCKPCSIQMANIL